MKRRKTLVLAGVVLFLALIVGVGMSQRYSRRPPTIEEKIAAIWVLPPPTWWERVQAQCYQLTGWPPPANLKQGAISVVVVTAE